MQELGAGVQGAAGRELPGRLSGQIEGPHDEPPVASRPTRGNNWTLQRPLAVRGRGVCKEEEVRLIPGTRGTRPLLTGDYVA